MTRNKTPGIFSRIPRVAFFLVSGAVLVADQSTKIIALKRLAPRGSISVVPGWFDLTFVMNQGALFGIGRNLREPLRTLAFTLLPMTAILYILYFLWRTPARDRLFLIGLSLILGGALGNLVDRLRVGYVVDFLDFYWRNHHWPAFNLADSSICIGVGLLGLDLFLKERRRDESPI